MKLFADKNSGGEVSVLRTYRFYDITTKALVKFS